MSHQSAKIEHVGVVEFVSAETICVSIVSTSACGSCHAKGACSMSEQTQKQIHIPNEGQLVSKGDTVNLVLEVSTGLKSVFFAYLIPVLILIVGLWGYSTFLKSEGISALLTLATIASYYLLLYLFRKKLERKFIMKIETY
ncbi:SoxR reducing system RseC family protein [Alistipes sp. ZOR0009]|uniref:SoxR reducing system RseC family protein n=1 Tax=Alistipes sp. ZOR0009 TaxID=1339253 RepID=UPI000646747E|nr:SoxR reducing system RseC family protein [Alistipes sp. ZOR0009]